MLAFIEEKNINLFDAHFYNVGSIKVDFADVTRKTLKEDKSMLYSNFQVEYSSNAEKIIHQSLKSGEYVKSGVS